MSEGLNEESLIDELAVHDRWLRNDVRRWAWWQAALLFGVGSLALMTQDNWWCAVFSACLAGICAERPNAVREANLEGYAAGWRRGRDGRL